MIKNILLSDDRLVHSRGVLLADDLFYLCHPHLYRSSAEGDLDYIALFYVVRGARLLAVDNDPSGVASLVRDRSALNKARNF